MNVTKVNWIKTTEETLPENKQRILFYRPTKLTKVGEMVFFEQDKEYFLEEVTHWAEQLNKPK